MGVLGRNVAFGVKEGWKGVSKGSVIVPAQGGDLKPSCFVFERGESYHACR